MSILIEGIDLPKKGKMIKLEIEDDGTVWEIGKEWEHYGLSAIQIDRPHGRIIDESDLKNELPNIQDLNFEDIAPTILEAEE